tara:strand:+ start:4382 stop:4753 length:372 start_codon:yes stop_codon:yes gene_type:complete
MIFNIVPPTLIPDNIPQLPPRALPLHRGKEEREEDDEEDGFEGGGEGEIEIVGFGGSRFVVGFLAFLNREIFFLIVHFSALQMVHLVDFVLLEEGGGGVLVVGVVPKYNFFFENISNFSDSLI